MQGLDRGGFNNLNNGNNKTLEANQYANYNSDREDAHRNNNHLNNTYSNTNNQNRVRNQSVDLRDRARMNTTTGNANLQPQSHQHS